MPTLLRASRLSATLTKQAGLITGAGKLVGKGVGKTIGSVGRFAKKHPIGALAGVGGIAAGVSVAKDNIQKGNVGFDPQYQAAQRWGGAPEIRPNKGTPVTYLRSQPITWTEPQLY